MSDQPPPDKATADAQVDPAPSSWRPPAKSRATVAAIIVLTLCAILAVLYAWRLPPFAGWSEKTDNAYVRGRVTIISPQVSGYVTHVTVQDFAEVKAGQVLATIDDRIYRARVAQAEANVAAQQASLANSAQAQRSREVATEAQNAGIANAQTATAWGYSTGYGNVYGSYGLAATMQKFGLVPAAPPGAPPR